MNNILDYTLNSILRHGGKNLLIATIFMFLVFMISSGVLIANSLKKEYYLISQSFPDIIIQKSYSGKKFFMNDYDIEFLYNIPSIELIQKRVWGIYHFEKQEVYATILGSDEIPAILAGENTEINNSFFISKNLYNALKDELEIYKKLAFFTPENEIEVVEFGGIYQKGSEFENSDIITLSNDNASKILGLKGGEFSDILINITNKNEISFISQKIRQNYPKLSLKTKDELIKEYEMTIDYKLGWFLALFLGALSAFVIILYDKISGISSSEKKEFIILKNIGWEASHIIEFKLIESSILAVFAFLLGVLFSLIFVYILNAPLLKGVFAGYQNLDFNPIFAFDLRVFAMLFFISVPLFIATSIIPAYKISVMDERC
ncbi:MAG: ABC transporter permease [Campylobacter sp.]|nr:ABC transporter permease [Campylobacter sp.]